MANTIKADILLKNGIIVTMNPNREVIKNGYLVITGDKIYKLGEMKTLNRSDYEVDQVIDCKNKVIMPGLIDAHGHGGHSLLKTIASDTPSIWEKILTEVYFHYTTEDFWLREGELSALERLKFGTTTGLSVLGSQPRSDDSFCAEMHAEAYGNVGIREIIAVGPANPPWPRKFSRWIDGKRVEKEVNFAVVMNNLEKTIQKVNGSFSNRIRVYPTPYLIVPSLDSKGPTPPDISELTEFDKKQSKAIRDLAAKYSTRIHSDAFGGMVKLAAEDPNGLLGPDVSLQHCKGLSLEEIKILADTDTRVSHAPGAGSSVRCPVTELVNAGVKVAISTDGTSPKTTFDLFQAIRKERLIQQRYFNDSFYMPAGKLLEMITIDAASVLGMDEEIGSLEKGKKADVITIDMNQPHLKPLFMVIHRLVNEVSGSDIDTVIVDGNILMKEREVSSVDEDEIMNRAQSEAEKTIKRANLEKHMQEPEGFWGKARMNPKKRLKD